jgi:hypothetical protein
MWRFLGFGRSKTETESGVSPEEKQRLKGLLLTIDVVTGVSFEGSELVVYLSEDSDRAKKKVASVIQQEKDRAHVSHIDYAVSGEFSAY